MCNRRGKPTRKSMRAITAAAVFLASGVLVSATDAAATWVRAQAAGQDQEQDSSQSSGLKSAPNSASRQANRTAETPASPAADQNAVTSTYKPARAVSAADTQYPFQTPADGMVVFDLSIDTRGQVKKTSVLRDVPPFTAAAEQSLRNWKFAPATESGEAEDSEMIVAFVFRHAVYIADPPVFTPIFPAKESEGGRSGFVPPAILNATYAGYPASTIAHGTIVAQANINADGSTGGVKVVRNLSGGFAPLAIEAAKQWRFQPALRDGKAVPSKVAISFVFSSRALNPF